jgi:hypothetical protein
MLVSKPKTVQKSGNATENRSEHEEHISINNEQKTEKEKPKENVVEEKKESLDEIQEVLIKSTISCINNNAKNNHCSCEIFRINDNNRVELIFSPRLANIEVVMAIYKGVLKYRLSQNDKIVISLCKQLEYILLNFMMKQLATISENVKEKSSEIKTSLLSYGIIISYQLSLLIYDELEKKTNDYHQLQNDIVSLSKIKLELIQRVEALREQINKQNEEIRKLQEKNSLNK